MRTSTALVAVLSLALAGCLDLDDEFTINPDGSGKVRIKCVSAPVNFDLTEKKSPEEIMKKSVRETLEQSAGVDAWSGVQASLRDDGKMSFTGTAYFKDIEQLRLKVMGATSTVSELVFKKEQDAVSVELTGEKKEEKAPEPPGTLTEEQLKDRMKEQRAKYQQSKPMMEAFIKDVKFHNRINLPGTLGEVHNFKKAGPSSVELSFDGASLLKVMEGLVMDDAFLRKSILEGRDLNQSGPGSDGAFMEKLFGENAPIKAMTKGPLKAAFNYEAEAAPARKNLPELLKKYGASPTPIPAAAGALFKSVRVAGVQIVHLAEGQRGIRPFNRNEPGLSFSIVAELGGAALSAKEGKVTRAVSDAGENLLPKDDFDRKIHFPRLSDDKKAIVFELQLGMPGPKVAAIKEISGSIQYVVADKTKEVDLGLGDFKKGSKGKEFGAQIDKIEPGFQEGRQELEIKLNLSHDDVESVSFFDASGKKLDVSGTGYSSSGKETSLTFQIKGQFPPTGRIVARVFDDPKTYDAPFTISNVDLMGRPQK
jgi:hypothetical protein